MTKKLDILNSQGAVVGEYVLPDEVIEMEKGEQAVHDAVVAFMADQRANTASVKTRGMVSGGGAKPFRQKGLGRARAGSNRSPVWVGGGTIFGPSPERNYTKKVNKKVAKLALRRAFSERVTEGNVMVVDAFELPDHKTKSAVAIFDALKIDDTLLFAVPDYEECVVCATGNLPTVALRKSSSVNVYELLCYNRVLFTKDALDAFVARLS
ncbi:MAG: 50S ribosomal protein L4 [Victivallaceae bacterium]|nr:50S ribosomal protein L4 [Victivallaceae bacterium]